MIHMRTRARQKLSRFKREFKRATKGVGFPIRDIYGDVLQLKDGTYKTVLKITQPINSSLMSEKELANSVRAIQQGLNGFGLGENNQILVSTERMNLGLYLEYLDDLYDRASNVFVQTRIEMKKKFLKDYMNEHKSVLSFYVVLSARARFLRHARIELRQKVKKFRAALRSGRMKLAVLKDEKLKQVLYEKFNPTKSRQVPFRKDMDIWNLKPDSIQDRPASNLDQIDYMTMDRVHYAAFYFSDFPESVGISWLYDLIHSGLNLDLSITLELGNKAKVVSATNESLRDIKMKLENRNKLDESEVIDLERDRDSLRNLLQTIKNRAENVFHTTYMLVIRESTVDDLEHSASSAQSLLGARGIEIRQVHFSQSGPRHDLLYYTVPIGYRNEDLQRRLYWPMSSRTVAAILPFDSNELNWNEGMFYGFNVNDMPITYDRWNRKIYYNGNTIILGTSGSGKSYLLRLIIWREANFGRADRIIVLDPEGEYPDIPDANVLHFYLGSGLVTNVFHIRSTVVDSDNEEIDGKVDVGGFLRQKIDRIVSFFSWIILDLGKDSYMRALLTEAIERTYALYGLTYEGYTRPTDPKRVPREVLDHYFRFREGEIKDHLPPLFPTLSDLMDELDALDEIYGDQVYRDTRLIRMALKPYVSGAYGGLFNGQTNWTLDEKINILNLSAVSGSDSAVKAPLMDLMISELWEEVKKDPSERILMAVDELRVLANKENPQTLMFLADAAKRFRKRRACLITATQNVDDVMAIEEYGRAVYNNSWFKFFMLMTDQDVDALSFVSFTDNEREMLRGDDELDDERPRGRCLHMVGRRRVEMQVVASPDEKEILNLPEEDEDGDEIRPLERNGYK